MLRWPDSSTFVDSFYFRRDATGGGPALLLWLFKLDAAPWTARGAARGAAPNQGSNFSFNSIYASRAAPGSNFCLMGGYEAVEITDRLCLLTSSAS